MLKFFRNHYMITGNVLVSAYLVAAGANLMWPVALIGLGTLTDYLRAKVRKAAR